MNELPTCAREGCNNKVNLHKNKFCSMSCSSKTNYYPKRNTFTFTGQSHTPKSRKKISEGNKGKFSPLKGKTYEQIHGAENAKKLREQHSLSKMGDKNPAKRPEVGKKISEVLTKAYAEGRLKSWTDGLTKETDERIRKSAEKCSKTKQQQIKDGTYRPSTLGMKYKLNLTLEQKAKRTEANIKTWKDPETRRKRIEGISKALKGKPKSKEHNKKISIRAKERMSNIQYKEKLMKKIFKSCEMKPNKLEQQFDTLLQKNFPNEWKYVGDGYTFIGGKCPDFLNVNGEKKLIELFGTYWHMERPKLTKQQAESLRVNHFAKYGFKTLVIWENELKHPNQVINRIRSWQ